MRVPMFRTALLAALLAPAVSAQQLATVPAWNGADAIRPFGADGASSTYGQTFYALNTSLDGFSFWLQDIDGATVGSTFRAHIAVWTGDAIGPILWSSALTGGQVGSGFNEYAFLTGGLGVAMGTQYVAFLQAHEGDGRWWMAASPGGTSTYADGGFVFSNRGYGDESLGDLEESWGGGLMYIADRDAHFVATFSDAGSGQEVVPEPATMSLMALGLAGMAGARRRRTKAAGTRRASVAPLALLALLTAAPLSAQTLDTHSTWNGSSGVGFFGAGDNASTFGQSFLALNTSLDAFSFWMSPSGTGIGSSFTAHIAAWDGNSVTGTIWSSGVISGLAGWQEYHVLTGGLAVTTGSQYVAFFQAAAGPDAWTMGGIHTDPYAGGGFFLTNVADGVAGLASLGADWAANPGFDARLVVDFSGSSGPTGPGQEVVPEPATLSLMALGLAAMAGGRRRKR